MGYPPEEFTARRQQLAKALQRGTLVMFGATAAPAGLRFRQDHDFYYLTGNESLNAVLVMDVPSGASHLFLPKLSEREIRYEGGNWLEDDGAARKYGFASIQPLTGLHEFLARRRGIPAASAVDPSVRTRLREPRPLRRRHQHGETLEQSIRAAPQRGRRPRHRASRAVSLLRDEGRRAAHRSAAD